MQSSIGDMTKHIIIYGRVSTAEQRHDSQIAEVQDYCARRWGDNSAVTIITDTASGAKTSREGLDRLMHLVRRGKVDVVACFKLDRLGRSRRSSSARNLEIFSAAFPHRAFGSADHSAVDRTLDPAVAAQE